MRVLQELDSHRMLPEEVPTAAQARAIVEGFEII